MIHIDRSTTAPPPNFNTGRRTALTRLRTILGTRALKAKDFSSARYGAARTTLSAAQSGKCCYCEKEIEDNEPVEHFRPKTSVRRARKGTVCPGYWWLAYTFDNLHLVCWGCNGSKSDLLPLLPGSRPLPVESQSVAHRRAERAAVLDPAFEPSGDRPEDHLTFQWVPGSGYEIAPINLSARGRATIDTVKLDRDSLKRMRRKYHKRSIEPLIQRFQDAIVNSDKVAETNAVAEATALVASDQPFSLMARVAFREARVLP